MNLFKSIGDGRALRIGFVGIGRSNLALMSRMPYGAVAVLRSDKRIPRDILPSGVTVGGIYEGEYALKDITEDVLVLSPSVRRDRPEIAEAMLRGVTVTSDIELFFDRVRAPVLAVTGSSGKSTTAALAHLMLGGVGKGSALVGNIGMPACLSPEDARIYVAELSSFMLEYCHGITERAVITNITPNHLDWHKTFDNYKRAKLSLMALSRETGVNMDDSILREAVGKKCIFGAVSTRLTLKELTGLCRAKVYMTYEDGYLTRNGEKLIHASALYRSDEYTVANMLSAVLLTDGYAKREQLLAALAGFGGLSHRAETVRRIGGVEYIDSSIDTTPERCGATLRSLNRPVILLLGGRGKGLSYSSATEEIRKYAKRIFAFGDERYNIAAAYGEICPVSLHERFCDGVRAAISAARDGDTVLLSPACTSYDEFTSFEERGETFKKIISEAEG